MDNELYDIAGKLKGFSDKTSWNIVLARKDGNQWKLIIEKEQEKVAQDDNN